MRKMLDAQVLLQKLRDKGQILAVEVVHQMLREPPTREENGCKLGGCGYCVYCEDL